METVWENKNANIFIPEKKKSEYNYSTGIATFTSFPVYLTANKRWLVSAFITLMTVNAESNYSREFVYLIYSWQVLTPATYKHRNR